MNEITERLERQEPDDIILLAELLETPGARLTRHLIENLLNKELSFSRHDQASSDRKIGRLEAYRTVLDDFDDFQRRKKELQAPVKPEPEATNIASEQSISPLRGGEI